MIGNLSPSYNKGVYVMRHGRTVLDDAKRSDGWLDFPLSDDGRRGLIHAQQYLKMAPIKCVYAPNLRRAKETAHIIASGVLSQPPIEISNEAKTWNLGVLMGGKKKPNRPQVKYYMDHPNEAPFGGESMSEFYARFIPWITKMLGEAKNGEGPLLIVTSGSNLRAIGDAMLGDKDVFDLNESGMIVLTPSTDGTVKGRVLFGHKDDSEDWS